MSNKIEIRVPDIGDFTGIPVIEVLVGVGDSVDAEQSLVTLESDKATMELPAPVAGVVRELHVALDDAVRNHGMECRIGVRPGGCAIQELANVVGRLVRVELQDKCTGGRCHNCLDFAGKLDQRVSRGD